MARDMKATRIVFDPPFNERGLLEVEIQRWPDKGITEVYVKWTGGQAWYGVPFDEKKRKGAVVYKVTPDALHDSETWSPVATSTGEDVAS